MNPLDAQRYDLSKRGLVSVTFFFALRPSTDHF